jgi:hypothetical protein
MEGGCLCGAVRYRAEGATDRATHCHCRHCRGSTGAPFVTWIEVPTSGFRFLSGEPGRHAARPGVERRFCTACGTCLTFQDREDSEIVDVTVASLDEPEAVTPEDHVWASRRLSWIHLDDGLPRYDTRRK